MNGARQSPSWDLTEQRPAMPDHASRSASSFTTSSLTLGTPNMRLTFERPDAGTELVRTVSGANAPSSVEIRFEPMTPSEQLTGQPTLWCNVPAPGQALVYNVPVPAIGGITSGTLTVTSSAGGGGTLIPVKVKHNL
jgi:hypothetical protein